MKCLQRVASPRDAETSKRRAGQRLFTKIGPESVPASPPWTETHAGQRSPKNDFPQPPVPAVMVVSKNGGNPNSGGLPPPPDPPGRLGDSSPRARRFAGSPGEGIPEPSRVVRGGSGMWAREGGARGVGTIYYAEPTNASILRPVFYAKEQGSRMRQYLPRVVSAPQMEPMTCSRNVVSRSARLQSTTKMPSVRRNTKALARCALLLASANVTLPRPVWILV